MVSPEFSSQSGTGENPAQLGSPSSAYDGDAKSVAGVLRLSRRMVIQVGMTVVTYYDASGKPTEQHVYWQRTVLGGASEHERPEQEPS